MQEHKPLYLYSREEALRHGERDQWRDSYRENCDCARAIERAIAENYHDNRLEDCAGGILDCYGFTRVNWVSQSDTITFCPYVKAVARLLPCLCGSYQVALGEG